MTPTYKKKIVLLNCLFFLFCPIFQTDARSEIKTDGTLGAAGLVHGPDYRIRADLGRQVGGNLFHSFSLFNIDTGETATFTGPAGVSNIINRVTGGTASTIDGKIISDIDGANLYLLNPAGIIFGSNASLSVSGAFHATTADYLRLGTEGRFDATRPDNSLLAAAPPAAFGFLGDNPGGISVQGRLTVPSGKTISIIGGDITVSGGSMVAMEGRIDMASVSDSGEVVPGDSDLGVPDIKRGGDIIVSGGSKIDVRGDSAGEVYIRSGRFEVKNPGTSVYALTGNSNGGGIDIHATEEVSIRDSGNIVTATQGAGFSGDVKIETNRLNLSSGGMVVSAGYGSGNCGNLSIAANESVDISGKGASGSSGLYTSSSSNSTGDVGGIAVETDLLNVHEAGAIVVETGGSGDAGDLSINAVESVSVTGAGKLSANSLSPGAGGKAGNILVSTGILNITDNGLVASESAGYGSPGNIGLDVDRLEMMKGYISSSRGAATGVVTPAGSISIAAKESVHIEGSGVKDSGLFGEYYGIYAQTQGSGDGGHIDIQTGNLTLTKDAMINGQTYGAGRGGNVALATDNLQVLQGGTITASTRGAGRAGDITISSGDSVLVSGAGVKTDTSWIYTATHSGGQGGDISISTPSLTISKGGAVYANTLGDDTWDANTLPDGPAGNIGLNTDRFNLMDGGAVSAGSESEGPGGNIEIAANESITISGSGDLNKAGFKQSGVYAWARQSGGGGRITMSTGMMTLSNNGQINSSASNSGKGGNINLHLRTLCLNENASISARSTGTGDAGEISISSGESVQIEQSTITTEADSADGGNIVLNAPYKLSLVDGEISATVKGGLGNGGNINIDPRFVILKNSRIIANAYGGRGGNIHITANQFLADPASIVQASSELGIDGTVVIDAPDADIIGGVTVLPEIFLNTAELDQDKCAARIVQNTISLIHAGRGGMPPSPDDFLQTGFFMDKALSSKADRQNSDLLQSD